MSKMTSVQLQKRKTELKKMVHAEIVRREVMQFRLEPHNIERLYEIALKSRKPVGTLLREWVTERIKEDVRTFEKARDHRRAAQTDVTVNAIRKPLEELKSSISVFEAAAKRLERMQSKSSR